MGSWNWGYFVLGFISYQIVHMLYMIATKGQQRRRERYFIKQVRIYFPDAEPIHIITVASSDKDAAKNIERRLRAQAESTSA